MNFGGWQTVTNRKAGWVHVVPKDDLKPHALTAQCDCQPVVEEADGVESALDLIVHNSFDGREAFETSERAVS